MKRLKILVVEDNPTNIEAAKVALRDHDVTIVTGYDQARTELKLEQFRDRCDAQMVLDGKSKWKIDEDCRQRARETLAEPFDLFDVVLTDCMIPKGGSKCMNAEGMRLVEKQGPMPYGPILALTALEVGVRYVGVITSGNHHTDPFVFAFDSMGDFKLGEAKVVCTNNADVWIDSKTFEKLPHDTEKPAKIAGKDWSAVLEWLLE